MLPTHERLDAGDLARGQIDLRLVVDPKLAGLNRHAQITQQAEAVAAVQVPLGGVDLVARARVLRLVHGHVGPLDERFDIGAVVGEARDSEARLHVDGEPPDRERLVEQALDPLHDRRGVLGVEPGQDHGELVAAQPRQGVGRAERVEDTGPDLPQQEVAGLVAQGVVQLLEAVEIGDQQRERLVEGARPAKLGGQPLVEVAPIRQPGELVGGGLAARLRERAGLAVAEREAGQGGDDREGGEH